MHFVGTFFETQCHIQTAVQK